MFGGIQTAPVVNRLDPSDSFYWLGWHAHERGEQLQQDCDPEYAKGWRARAAWLGLDL